MSATNRTGKQDLLEAFFLPDLCNTRAVIILLALSEALVLALTLMESSLPGFSWQRFTVVSFFVQWVCLLSVAVLCQLRVVLVRLAAVPASLVAVGVVQLVTLLVSVAGECLWPLDSSHIDWPWVWRNVLIGTVFGAMAMRYFYVQSQWRLKAQAELRSRLAALQANIRPHFFFNTLNTVASLIPVDPDKAEHMLLDLAQLFRAVLKSEQARLSLSAEIELGKRYLDIEQVRIGDRLTVEWHLPATLPSLEVPQLILQPLLENAVYHGIQASAAPGYIHIELQSAGDGWQLLIRNSKPPVVSGHAGNQMAQDNIRSRLQALDPAAGLSTEETATEYIACLRLPQTRASDRQKGMA
ncbi:sensor histidine kinase [Thalassolituus sp. LLYu03]|uniref:sensor histidine kinase n=1 Tax=Thalassolituus sp. LLYu03 TaxID=3421656 RepID=UPI003D2BB909